jgi:hypothetical protein
MHHVAGLTQPHAAHLPEHDGAHDIQPTPQVREFWNEAVAALEDGDVDLECGDFREEIDPVRQECQITARHNRPRAALRVQEFARLVPSRASAGLVGLLQCVHLLGEGLQPLHEHVSDPGRDPPASTAAASRPRATRSSPASGEHATGPQRPDGSDAI